LTLLGLGLPFLVMANDRRWIVSPYVGVVGCGAAALGLMRLLGAFRASSAPEPSASRSQVKELGLGIASALAFIIAVRLAVAGVYPLRKLVASVLVTCSFLLLVVALPRLAPYFGLYAGDAGDEPRSSLQRPGYWLVLSTTLWSLPGPGLFG